jgi:hypothetical protein
VLSVRVIQEVEGLGDDGIRENELSTVLQLPLDGRVTDRAYAVRARQQDWAFEKTRFPDPVDAGHVAVAILVEGCGKDGIPVSARPGQDRGHTGTDRALAGDQPALTFD